MAENIKRSKSQASNYSYSRGGTTAEFGPFIGIVKYNVDPTRSGRVQVYLPEFGGDETQSENWRTVSYASPFFGITPHSGSTTTEGIEEGNPHSYGFWATPPDVGVRLLCIFANGDPNFGYYIACLPEPGANHMVPAIGSTAKFIYADGAKYGNPPRLPVVEYNIRNVAITETAKPHDQLKPVHKKHAKSLHQQGLIKDTTRGIIGSSAQRESPSRVLGISSPGRPIYQAGLNETNTKTKLLNGSVTKPDMVVVGRKGGHTMVFDDGDLSGDDQLIRFRTSGGHQVMMNDTDECIHIIHSNGTSWVELGKEGTVDVYGTTSVNVRTGGHLNLHADKDININAGEHVNIKGKKSVKVESDELVQILSEKDYMQYAKTSIRTKSDGTIDQLSATTTRTTSGSPMYIVGTKIFLNTGGASTIKKPENILIHKLPDVKWDKDKEWKITNTVETIVTRMITHEPYPFHNMGIDGVTVKLEK